MRVPSTLSSDVLGVIGLKNTVRLRSSIVRPASPQRLAATPNAKGSSCELPYPSESDFFTYATDSCPANANGYAGDIEVDADIETSLAVAPDARQIDVYNAPNDETGQTSLGEWAVIARQDSADTISSSWGECENDVSAGYVQAENVLFEQMAMQGQSVFGGSGDTGALDCIETDGTTVQNTGDPPSQPRMTSVGGTPLEARIRAPTTSLAADRASRSLTTTASSR